MIEIEKFESGHYEQGYGYKYFVPSFINDEWGWNDLSINHLLEKAAIKLGELNSFSKLVPNIDLFIQLHVMKEAVDSSRIEGTQTRIDEAKMRTAAQEAASQIALRDWGKVAVGEGQHIRFC